MAFLHISGFVMKLYAVVCMDSASMSSSVIKLILLDNLTASLTSSYNLPSFMHQHLWAIPPYVAITLWAWLNPHNGLCGEVCHRAARGDESFASLLKCVSFFPLQEFLGLCVFVCY